MAVCYCTKAECAALAARILVLERLIKDLEARLTSHEKAPIPKAHKLEEEYCTTRECSRIRQIAIEAKRKAIAVDLDLQGHKGKEIPEAHRYRPKVGVQVSGGASGNQIKIFARVNVDGSSGNDSATFSLNPNLSVDFSLAASADGTLKGFSKVCVLGTCASDSATVKLPLSSGPGGGNGLRPRFPNLPRINRPGLPILPIPIPRLPSLPSPRLPTFGVPVGVPVGGGLGLRGIGGGGASIEDALNRLKVTVAHTFDTEQGILTTTVTVGKARGTGRVKIDMEEIRRNTKRIYEILGGDRWFEDGEKPKIELDIESYIKGFVAGQWGLEAEKTNPLPAELNDVIDVVGAISSLNYFRQGLQEFPLTVPKNLTELPPEGEGETTEKIPYASKFTAWEVEQIDALFGQFPIKIRIEDNDLIKTGAQPFNIELPNLAETVAELIGKSITNESMVNLLVNINFRLLNELGSTKLQGFKSYRTLETIAAYLGYEDGQKKEKVRFLYNPLYQVGEGESPNFEQLLTETEIDVVVDELKEKFSLESKLDNLLFAAAIIRAANFEEVNPNNDGKWEQFVSGYKDLVNAFSNESEKEKDDFDEFLDRVEEGFTTEPGITDPTKPYGRPRDQRPRVRKLGADNDGAD